MAEKRGTATGTAYPLPSSPPLPLLPPPSPPRCPVQPRSDSTTLRLPFNRLIYLGASAQVFCPSCILSLPLPSCPSLSPRSPAPPYALCPLHATRRVLQAPWAALFEALTEYLHKTKTLQNLLLKVFFRVISIYFWCG
ncbi:hypothetical protein E2C01_101887 [Portunus trituberculatus]|uniref:Uncharacterized protein n=1 Tax=Portunus trituberculatus TaxID=210409 RepID=A0A5B7KFY7_PORTR|nr:hypothetical protein [Portunus trituberculatus]